MNSAHVRRRRRHHHHRRRRRHLDCTKTRIIRHNKAKDTQINQSENQASSQTQFFEGGKIMFWSKEQIWGIAAPLPVANCLQKTALLP